MRRLLCVLTCVAMSACAGMATEQDEIRGQSAYIRDGWALDADGATALFVVVAIDGKAIKNSIGATRLASQRIGGRPFHPTVDVVGRKVPAVSAQYTLRGTHTTKAPIQEIAARATGSFLSVEGTVEFTPQPEGLYVVKGDLRKDESSVWIVDLNTDHVVSKKVTE